MYSGSGFNAFGVAEADLRIPSGMLSNAEPNGASIADGGSEIESRPMVNLLPNPNGRSEIAPLFDAASFSAAVANGFLTSRATLSITSNSDASTSLGSR